MTAEIYWHDPATNTAWTEREIAIRNLNTSGFVRMSPPAPLPDLDPKRMLGYDAIRYVAGYPESYVKEYAAALLESERQAHAAEVERLRGDAERWSAEDREIMAAVVRELGEGDDGNAPGHAHSLPGIWDWDNGERAGKACSWCLCWAKFTKLVAIDQAIARGKT